MTLRMRPRFEMTVAQPRDEAFDRMKARLEAGPAPYHVALLNGQIEVSPRQDKLHFWSPYLKVRLQEEGQETTLRGRFGPNVNLWTLLVAIYSICGLVGGTGLLVALSQWQLGQSLSGLILAAICAAIAAAVWVAAQIGQRFAQDQMRGIHGFLAEVYQGVLVDSGGDVEAPQEVHP